MEKLIELLNEFKPTVSCANFKEHYEFIDDDIYLIREGIDGEEEHFPMYVCYKKGDFIKRLIENEKIDISKIKCGYVYNDTEEDKVKNVIMNLSISDAPIDDLILYLS